MTRKRRKWLIWLLGVLGFIFVLPFILALIVSLPRVQTKIVNFIAERALSDYGVELTVSKVKLTYTLGFKADDIVLSREGNKMISMNSLTFYVRNISYKKKSIDLLGLTLQGSSLAMTIAKGDSISDLQRFLDQLLPTDTPANPDAWSYQVRQVKLMDLNFIYNDWNEDPVAQGFDFNHISLQHLDAEIDRIKSDTAGLSLRLASLKAEVSEEFNIRNISSFIRWDGAGLDLDSLRILTENSAINLNARLDIDTSTSITSIYDRFRFKVFVRESTLDFNELAYFIPEIRGMSEKVEFNGAIRGTLSNLKARDLIVSIDNHTRFKGDVSLMGLPVIHETFINLDIQYLITNIDKVAEFTLPGGRKVGDMGMPVELSRLGDIRLSGYLTGYYYDFVSDASLITDIGSLTTDISIKEGTSLATIKYDGKVMVKSLDLGTLIDMKEWLGMISFNASVSGRRLDEGTQFTVNGVVESVDIYGYNYDTVLLDGKYASRMFDGSIKVTDDNVDLEFLGIVDLSSKVPVFDFSADIKNASLARLHLVEREGDPTLKAMIKAKGEGMTLESLKGSIQFTDIVYTERGTNYSLDSLEIIARNGPGSSRGITLRSDLIDADLNGAYRYDDLERLVGQAIHAISPSFPQSLGLNPGAGSYVDIVVTVKDVNPLLKVFKPDLSLPQGLKLEGRIEQTGHIDFKVDVPIVRLGDQFLETLNLAIEGERTSGGCKMTVSHLYLSDSLQMHELLLLCDGRADTLNYNLSWTDPGIGMPLDGVIKGFASYSSYPNLELSLTGSRFFVNHNAWEISHSSPVIIDTSMSITVSDLILSSRNMSFKADGSLSRDPDKSLTVSFTDYNLSDIDFITTYFDVNLDGIVNGTATLKNIFVEPNIVSNLRIDGFAFNGDTLGDAILKSNWDKQKKGIELSLKIISKGNIGSATTLAGQGWYYPSDEKNQFDVDFDLNGVRIGTLKNFLSGLTSDISGTATGNLKLSGTIAEPTLVGKVNVYHARLKVDYLNTYYTFADEIVFTKDGIRFNNVVLSDNNGPQVLGKTAVVNGVIYHNHFQDWRFDLRIETKSFTFLNTSYTYNEYFYGKAVAGGTVRITGPVDDIKMEIKARTDKGTVFNVPLTYPEDISSIDFIQYVSKDSNEVKDTVARKVSLDRMRMDFDLDVTQDAEVNLIFDEKIGDVIKASGNGNISMEIDTRGDFLMFGIYTIQYGEYLFTLQNVVNKSFDIMPGGTIRWTGNPYDAELDVTATYTVYTSVYNLGLGLDTSRRRVPVECRLFLTGNLNYPTIEKSIEFPGMNSFEAEQYKAAIQPSLNTQFLALLVMNSFLYAGNEKQGIGTFAGTALGTGYSEFISSQLSNWLSKLSNEFDIGVNYRPEDELSPEQLQVMLSTQLFKDRLSIDGNFDMGGARNAGSTQGSQNSSSIVGDVNLEYKITPEGRFKVKAFNRSNYHDILNSKAPYTQGVGVFYRKEFDTWRSLFQRKELPK